MGMTPLQRKQLEMLRQKRESDQRAFAAGKPSPTISASGSDLKMPSKPTPTPAPAPYQPAPNLKTVEQARADAQKALGGVTVPTGSTSTASSSAPGAAAEGWHYEAAPGYAGGVKLVQGAVGAKTAAEALAGSSSSKYKPGEYIPNASMTPEQNAEAKYKHDNPDAPASYGDVGKGIIQGEIDEENKNAEDLGLAPVYNSIDQQYKDTIANQRKNKAFQEQQMLIEKGKAQEGIDKTTEQLKYAEDASKGMLSGDREGFSSDSNVAASSKFTAAVKTMTDRLSMERIQIDDRMKNAQENLDYAERQGNQTLIKTYSGQLAAAKQQAMLLDQQIVENEQKVMAQSLDFLKKIQDSGVLIGADQATLQTISDTYGIDFGLLKAASDSATKSQGDTAAQQKFNNQVTALTTFSGLVSSGIEIPDNVLQSFAESTGLPSDELFKFNRTSAAIMADKKLSLEQKQVLIDQEKEKLSQLQKGIYTAAAQNAEFLKKLYKDGADPGIISAFKAAAGIPDYDDPLTKAKYAFDVAAAQKAAIDADVAYRQSQGIPVTFDDMMRKKEVDIAYLQAEKALKDLDGKKEDDDPFSGLGASDDPFSGLGAGGGGNTPSGPIVAATIGAKKVKGQEVFINALAQADADFFAATGEHIKVNEAYRTSERQKQLYDKLSKKGARVAPPGQSFHEHGLAADIGNWKEAAPFLKKYGIVNGLKGDMNHFSMGEMNPGVFLASTSSKGKKRMIADVGQSDVSNIGSATEMVEESGEMGRGPKGPSSGKEWTGIGSWTTGDYRLDANNKGYTKSDLGAKTYVDLIKSGASPDQIKYYAGDNLSANLPEPKTANDVVYVDKNGATSTLSDWYGYSPTPIFGYDYINLSTLADDQKQIAVKAGQKLGIARLNDEQMNSLDNIKNVLTLIPEMKQRLYASLPEYNADPTFGPLGNAMNQSVYGTLNSAAAFTGANSELSLYIGDTRKNALDMVKVIAAGMGTRGAQRLMGVAETMLPNLDDNRYEFDQKMEKLQKELEIAEQNIITNAGGKLRSNTDIVEEEEGDYTYR